MEPLVTIAIPTLGRIELLMQALASARAQTYARVEILIGDNSADPALRSRIENAANSVSGTRLLSQSRRLSMAEHWNALADDARGEWFVILADDDFLEPDFVRKLVELRGTDDSIGVAFSDHRIIDARGRVDLESTEFYANENGRTILPEGKLADAASAVWRGSVPICSALIETRLVRHHRFRTDLNTPEIEFFARLAEAGSHFAYTSARLARYRVHDASETQVSGLRNDRLFEALKEVRAPEPAEPLRRRFLENLVVTAVSQAFHTGDMTKVRRFLDDAFYPRNGRPVSKLQRAVARLPNFLAPAAYRFLYRMLRPLRGRRPLSQ